MNLDPSRASFMQLVDQTIDRICGISELPPQPKYSVKAMLQRSRLQLSIEESQAKLETARALEAAYRGSLVALYASLAYHAERCRFRLEVRDWVQVPSEEIIALSKLGVQITEAEASHEEMVETIAELSKSIAENQREMDTTPWQEVK